MNVIYLRQGKYDEAIAEGEKAAAMEPNCAVHYARLAAALHFAGRPNEAIPNAKKAMRLNPYYPAWYLTDLAGPYYMTGQYSEALETYNKLLERSLKGEFFPIFVHERLAITYASLDQMEKARSHADEILKINPKYTVEFFRHSTPYKDRAYLDGLVRLLVKAGLPEKPPLPLPDKPSIAVLPFVNMSEDKSQEFFSDGLTEEIITALSKTPKLFVIARNSSFVYKGKPVNVQQVGRELGVKYVLEGSVRRSADQLRITAQLIDAATGNHLWAERYDREMKDVFAIQDELTIKILASILGTTLTEEGRARHFVRGASNVEAFLKNLEGTALFYKYNKDDNALARKKFEEAIALDPKWALPYTGLSVTYYIDFISGRTPQESLGRTYEYAQRAISLDNTQVFALNALRMAYQAQKRYEEAIAAAEQAIKVAPGLGDAYAWLGETLLLYGEYKEALVYFEKALRMNPFPETYYFMDIGAAHLILRNYEEAVPMFKKALSMSPMNSIARGGLIVTYVEMGRTEEARSEVEEGIKINPKWTSKGYERRSLYQDPRVTERYIEAYRKAGLEREISPN